MKIPALTIHQPYASLIMHGLKRMETRSWKTSYRGPLAIHAGAKKLMSMDLGWPQSLTREVIGAIGDLRDLPRGAVIGVVYLHSIWETNGPLPEPHLLTTNEFEFGDFSSGRCAWRLTHPGCLESSHTQRGQQRLWYWEVPKCEEKIVNQTAKRAT